jgi:hypothetical protein
VFVDVAQMRARDNGRKDNQDASDKERADPEAAMKPWHRKTL